MKKTYDVIVLGLGAMGSSSVYHLAGRGQKVLGLEQFTPAHDRGAHHGKSRVIRQSYFEDPAYVPLLFRAYDLWRKLEQETGESLLFEVGGIMIGSETSSVFGGSLESALRHNLPHEVLGSAEIRRRFPALTPESHMKGLFETRAGYLIPEKCVLAHLKKAEEFGAELHFEERVLGWEATSKGGVRVRTSKGEYEAGRLVISPGPWAPQVLSDAGLPPLEVERKVLYWFDPKGGVEPFLPDRFPIFILEREDNSQLYGFPAIEGPQGGVKVAFHLMPPTVYCTPETIDRTVHPEETERMRRTIAELIPALDAPCIQSATCMYTCTPDKNFIMAEHPRHPQVILGYGFSGHGFKFSSVVGEVLADLVVRGETSQEIGFLQLDRFLK